MRVTEDILEERFAKIAHAQLMQSIGGNSAGFAIKRFEKETMLAKREECELKGWALYGTTDSWAAISPDDTEVVNSNFRRGGYEIGVWNLNGSAVV